MTQIYSVAEDYGGAVHVRLARRPELAVALAEMFTGGPPVAPLPLDDPDPVIQAVRPDLVLEVADTGLVVTTSGSTGTPKAVLLSREALRHSAAATDQRLGGPGRWTCVLPPHHIAGVMTLVRSVLAHREPVLAGADLSGLAAPDGDREYLSVVPAQLHRALEDPSLTERLRHFHAILVGGAATDQRLLERGLAAGLRLVTSYGMSETCGGCVYDGVPLDGVRIERADGLLRVAGPVLFSGYRLAPALTREVLSGGWLRTADRGRLVAGRWQVTGRADDVVITGGTNVDLAEVQRRCDLVFGTPEAGGVVILAVPDERWGVRIVAATTARRDLAELQAGLTPALSASALPRQVWRVSEWPTTGSGKIDRQALMAAAVEGT
ncbi:MAG: AMP-binding protein [Micropruina sp.]|nr:AMP-binding protein [Micropruina sp.]